MLVNGEIMNNWLQDIIEQRAISIAKRMAESKYIGKLEKDGSKISLIDDLKLIRTPNSSDMNFHFSFYTQAYYPRPEKKIMSIPFGLILYELT